MADRSTPQDAAELARLLAERGPLDSARAVPREVVVAHEGRVPGILLDLWEDHGVGDLAGGRIKLCVPTELDGAVAHLFGGDPNFGPSPVGAGTETGAGGATDVHAIAHGPFGSLILWSERHGLVLVDMRLGMVEAPFLFRPGTAPPPDAAILGMVLSADPAFLDLTDASGAMMFERAVAAHGRLGRMRIYAPGAAEGGAAKPPTVEGLIPVPYRDWLEDRVVSKVWRLSDLATGRTDVRRIGAAR